MFRRISAVLALVVALPAHATELCAWLNETNQPGHVRSLDLWLQSDTAMAFLYSISGKGIVSGPDAANNPVDGSYSLRQGQPVKLWHFDKTFYPPGRIDVELEIRKVATDYYSGAPTAVLANYVFKRSVPDSETTPPDTLAKKFCAEMMEGQ